MRQTLFIDGSWQAAADGEQREIRCPADGSIVTTVAEGGPPDAEAAVAAARRAFDHGPWPRTPIADRAALLRAVARRLRAERDDVARMEALDTGKRFVEAQFDVDDVTAVFDYYADLAAQDAERTVDTGRADVVSRVVHEPVGVCALITPWNYPLLQTSWKVAPALVAGCTFVLKPSELTPSTAIWLLRVLAEEGLPAGVGNLVLGAGDRAGAPLVSHPDVDMVSFTGGLSTGVAISAVAAQTVKRVALELGGKNPNVVFADADFEAAVDGALTAVFLDSGQVCSAGTRLVVEESLHKKFVDELVRRAERIRLGGPFDPEAETGPLISAAHRENVAAYVARAVEQGAVLRTGGCRPSGDDLDDGFYYRPTILDACDSTMDCVHDESFGPVLTVETFRGETAADAEDAAVAIANDTRYGLAGAVWTQDSDRARRVAGRLRHGTVWINDYHPYVPAAEWGGFGQSGNGRELGPTGLAEYREVKHIWENTAPAPQHWFRP